MWPHHPSKKYSVLHYKKNDSWIFWLVLNLHIKFGVPKVLAQTITKDSLAKKASQRNSSLQKKPYSVFKSNSIILYLSSEIRRCVWKYIQFGVTNTKLKTYSLDNESYIFTLKGQTWINKQDEISKFGLNWIGLPNCNINCHQVFYKQTMCCVSLLNKIKSNKSLFQAFDIHNICASLLTWWELYYRFTTKRIAKNIILSRKYHFTNWQ